MKKLSTVTVFLLFLQSHTFSQTSFARDNMQFLVRGKALGFVIIEDTWVRSFSLGTEIKFYDRFSFVADVVHFRWRYEAEVHDLPDPEEYSEYSQFDARNYLAFELRYYPKLGFLKENFMPYVNVFSKFGKRNQYNQDKYPITEGSIVRLNSAFQDLGASLGFEVGERFGVDVNIGAVHRWEIKDEQVYHPGASVTYNDNISENRWMPNIRVNLYWNFSK